MMQNQSEMHFAAYIFILVILWDSHQNLQKGPEAPKIEAHVEEVVFCDAKNVSRLIEFLYNANNDGISFMHIMDVN